MMKKHRTKTLKVILMMTLFVFVMNTMKAQTALDSLRMPYDSLDTKYFPSKLLHNRSPYYFNSFKYDTISNNLVLDTSYKANPYSFQYGTIKMKRSAFFRIYREMLYSANDTNVLITPPVYFNNQKIALQQTEVPISLMCLTFNRLNESAMKNEQIWFDTVNNVYTIMPDTLFFPSVITTPDTTIINPGTNTYKVYPNAEQLAYSAFSNSSLYGGTIKRNVIYKQSNNCTIQYKIDSNLLISNFDTLPVLIVDFDDGQGYRNINWNTDININYNLSSSQKKHTKIISIKIPGKRDVVIEIEIEIFVYSEFPDEVVNTDTFKF